MKKIILSVGFCLLLAGQALAKDVLVTWVTEEKGKAQGVLNAETAANFVVGLGVTEVSVSLTARQQMFTGLEPGTYAIWVSCVDGNAKELAPAITGSVVVPEDATAPIPVTIGGAVK